MSGTTDWKARAEREAAAILAEIGYDADDFVGYSRLVSLLGIAWLQGTNYGTHETLADVERGFERMRESL